ncbi:hypothetical protein AGRA3207_003040 [Actinomadura graeca]|uniref:DUF3558 domain-containing protein n=1 Tax=Actinomadura graeca TaxID=2750812 RepID=A0ABX8QTF5_9ACTN|nr:hypothetical protein [Actinomadura graeca]QXJ22094.1 hypothetical protein AGRA3207_003040 [Actinomadura graeca]
MKKSVAALGVVFPVVLSGVAGCQAEKKAAPDLRPVVDGAPYLCDLVPEAGFRRVTGLKVPVTARFDGPQIDSGLCLARAAGRDAPLGLHWSFRDAESTLRLQREKRSEVPTFTLPGDLGEGLAVVLPFSIAYPRPNYVIAVFECGGKRPWVRIDFAPVVRGRDAVRDMVDFMRIAERRFGEIHRCGPKPI